MCARLLACPLCSQPGFLTLDALRAGLVSVATRPLACPVCNEVLLGIDKLTIHLFGHTFSAGNVPVGGGNESAKIIEVANNAQLVRNAIQSWNALNAQTLDATNVQTNETNARDNNTTSGIYIPIDEIEAFRNLTGIKDGNAVIPNVTNEMKAPSQVILLQNVGSQPKLFSADLIDQIVKPHEQPNIYSTSTSNMTNAEVGQQNAQANGVGIGIQDEAIDHDSSQSSFPRSHTDRLEELVKSAQITTSPLGTFHEAYDCSRPQSPKDHNPAANKLHIKCTRILSAAERMERCNICGISFPSRNVLILHKQLVHMIKEKDADISPDDLMKNYPCHLCTKVFKMRGSLMVHMRVAHPGVNIPRVISPTPEPILRESSELETLSDEPEGNYICPTCGKSFKKENQVTQHIKIHDTKQFECDVCSKLFTTKYFLKKHKRLHSGEMPYKCNICDKTFTFQQSYHKHRLYHKDDKPHTCNVCGRSFKELSTLHNHERIHTGEKPFACETCGKCFRQRVSYLVHRRIHTGAMPYQCLACSKCFRYKVSQRTHKCPMQPQDAAEQQSAEASQASIGNTEMREALEVSSQDEHSMDESVTSEDNQYILVLSNDGQHVLKKKSEIDNEASKSTSDNSTEQSKPTANDDGNLVDNMWSQDQSSEMEFKESDPKNEKTKENSIENSNLWSESFDNKNDTQVSNDNNSNDLWNQIASNNASADKPFEKSGSNNTRDFLSMILDNEMTSPSTEMEHLRLSSPVNHQENSSETNDCFPPMSNNNNASAVQVDHSHMEETFNHNNLSTLQTINEDSLKELLNSITDK